MLGKTLLGGDEFLYHINDFTELVYREALNLKGGWQLTVPYSSDIERMFRSGTSGSGTSGNQFLIVGSVICGIMVVDDHTNTVDYTGLTHPSADREVSGIRRITPTSDDYVIIGTDVLGIFENYVTQATYANTGNAAEIILDMIDERMNDLNVPHVNASLYLPPWTVDSSTFTTTEADITVGYEWDNLLMMIRDVMRQWPERVHLNFTPIVGTKGSLPYYTGGFHVELSTLTESPFFLTMQGDSSTSFERRTSRVTSASNAYSVDPDGTLNPLVSTPGYGYGPFQGYQVTEGLALTGGAGASDAVKTAAMDALRAGGREVVNEVGVSFESLHEFHVGETVEIVDHNGNSAPYPITEKITTINANGISRRYQIDGNGITNRYVTSESIELLTWA